MFFLRAAGVLLTLLFFLFFALRLVTTAVATQQATEQWPLVEPIFRSASCLGCLSSQKDGVTDVGVLFEGVGGAIGADGYSLLLCDVGGSGSTVRVVNKSGIFTIAGSNSRRCSTDGPALDACFNRPQSVVNVNGELYVADTYNNIIRKISSDGTVSSFIVDQVTTPSYIIPYNRGGNSYDLFVSDTGGSGIVFVTITHTPVTTTLATGLQPRELQLSSRDNKMYAYSNLYDIKVMSMIKDHTGTNPTWTIGNVSCMGYVSSLMLMEEEEKLYYFGKLKGRHGILALSTNTQKDEANKLCPTMVKELTFTDVKSLVKISKDAFYIVRPTSVYIARNSAFKFPDPQKPDIPAKKNPKAPPLKPQTPQTPQEAPKQPSGRLPNPPMKRSPRQKDVPTIPPQLVRGTAVAAFPTVSLPEKDNALMHELYMWMMKDVGIALGTDDFIAVFGPDGRNEVSGGVNVSSWRNLTTVRSIDGSIIITEYKGPLGVSSERVQRSLFSSPWTWTRRFLDSLRKQESLKDLKELCMINCVDDCVTMSFSGKECVKYVPPSPLCNDICIGAIVSSSVLAATGASLVGLMFVEPANALRAALLVPPI